MSVEPRRGHGVVSLAIVVEGSLLLLALGCGWLLGVSPLAQIRFQWHTPCLAVAATLPLLLALRWCGHSRWKPLADLFRKLDGLLLPLFARCSVLELAAISILAGIAEESLFRGVLQTALADWLGPPVALVAASMVFGVAHFITPTYALAASLVGFYLGALLMISGNLLLPIIAHALYDLVALVYLVRKYG